MSSIHFRAGTVNLELSGSESFVNRQLLLLSGFLGPVDPSAFDGFVADEVRQGTNSPAEEAPVEPAEGGDELVAPGGNGSATAAEPAPEGVSSPAAPPSETDELLGFFRAHEPHGGDRQAQAALLFAYYLQRRKGRSSLGLSDLIRCCIRAGVDTRNFNRTLGTLTRRGLFETLRHGHAYRLSEQGVAAVEQRI